MSFGNLIAQLSYNTTVGSVTPFHPDSVPSVVMFPFIEPPGYWCHGCKLASLPT